MRSLEKRLSGPFPFAQHYAHWKDPSVQRVGECVCRLGMQECRRLERVRHQRFCVQHLEDLPVPQMCLESLHHDVRAKAGQTLDVLGFRRGKTNFANHRLMCATSSEAIFSGVGPCSEQFWRDLIDFQIGRLCAHEYCNKQLKRCLMIEWNRYLRIQFFKHF